MASSRGTAEGAVQLRFAVITSSTLQGGSVVQDGLIEDYYGQGRHAHKLLVDLQESDAAKRFLAGQ